MKRAGVVVRRGEGAPRQQVGLEIVEFADQATAQNAIASLTDYELDGRSIFVRETTAAAATAAAAAAQGHARAARTAAAGPPLARNRLLSAPHDMTKHAGWTPARPTRGTETGRIIKRKGRFAEFLSHAAAES